MKTTQHNIEGLGEKFNLDSFLQARATTKLVISEICKGLEESDGSYSETDLQELIERQLRATGAEGFWHPTKVRIGHHTTKNFRETLSADKHRLRDTLISIDVGPIYAQHEADFAVTYQFGNNPEYQRLIDASVAVFEQTAQAWRQQKLSGPHLYEYAARQAEKLGLRLNLNMDGHRLGDFPHALYYKGGLAEFASTPLAHVWVLEIHLINDDLQVGAFFEDILV